MGQVAEISFSSVGRMKYLISRKLSSCPPVCWGQQTCSAQPVLSTKRKHFQLFVFRLPTRGALIFLPNSKKFAEKINLAINFCMWVSGVELTPHSSTVPYLGLEVEVVVPYSLCLCLL